MYFILIGAGQGTRLGPLTVHLPKCLIPVKGRPIMTWQFEAARRIGVNDLAVVCGYKSEKVRPKEVRIFENTDFSSTNMVASLWKAESIFKEGFIISYGDIIYEDRLLQAICQAPEGVNVMVDDGWLNYWEERFTDVLSDAETLKIEDEWICEIGQKATDLAEIQSQFVGLLSIKGDGVKVWRDVYESLRKKVASDDDPGWTQNRFDNMYMTDLVQAVIDYGYPVRPVHVNRGWVEIDSQKDLKIAEERISISTGSLSIR